MSRSKKTRELIVHSYMDRYFFDRENFEHIRSSLQRAIHNKFSYDIDDMFDDNIIQLMEYILPRYKAEEGETLEDSINAMNRQVFTMVFRRLEERLSGSPQDLLEERRRERQEPLLTPTIRPSPPPSGFSETVGGTSSPILLEEEENPIEALHSGGSIIGESPQMVPQVREERKRPEYRPVEDWRALLIDSRFRQGGTPGDFTVKLPAPVEVLSINCLDATVPLEAPYLLLEIEQIKGAFSFDTIFAKLLPAGNGIWRPSGKGIEYQFPQLVQTLSLRLMLPTRQPIPLQDRLPIERFEEGRDGSTRIVLHSPEVLEEISGRIQLKQSLKRGEVVMTRQDWTFRDTDRGVWMYGNYAGVEPGRGDFLHLTARSSGESERREHYYLPIIDGTESGALLVTDRLEMRDRIDIVAIIEGTSSDADGSKEEEDMFEGDYFRVTRSYKTGGGLVDKFEIDLPYERLTERDHLGERRVILDDKQVSFTFQYSSSSSSSSGTSAGRSIE